MKNGFFLAIPRLIVRFYISEHSRLYIFTLHLPFLDITAHWITNNWELKEMLLGPRRLNIVAVSHLNKSM